MKLAAIAQVSVLLAALAVAGCDSSSSLSNPVSGSPLACQRAASAALEQCFSAVAARTAACYAADGRACDAADAQIQASLDLLAGKVLPACDSAATVQQAGYGINISRDGVLNQLRAACIGEPASLVARTYGGPQAARLNTANPADAQCLTTAYAQAAATIQTDYAALSACLNDPDCSATADSSARDAQTQATLLAACPATEQTLGSSAQLFVERAKHQAQCLVAVGHGNTSKLPLQCGPDSVLLDAVQINTIDFAPSGLTVDTIPRATPLQIVLDSQAWGTVCADGSPYAFQLRLAPPGEPVDKLITHMEGGGVCLVGSGDCVSRPARLFQALDNGAQELERGYLSRHPDNPFRDWTVLHQPYCNQDLFIGGGVDEPGGPPEHNGFVRRYGAINLRASMRFFRDLLWRLRRDGRVEGSEFGYLPSQPRLLFSGTSAGGYGVQYNLHYPLDELRWENTIGHPHAAFLMPDGSTNLRLLLQSFGFAWGARPYLPPYCNETDCGISEVNHLAHAARLGQTPYQWLLNSSAQHDTVQEPTQGYPGPVAPPAPLPGFEAKDWINRMRTAYCTLKDTPNLNFHLGANPQGTHDFINTPAPFEPHQVCVPQLLVQGQGMLRWLHGIAEHGGDAAIDRVAEGPTLDGVAPFACALTPPQADGDQDGDGIVNRLDLCPGTPPALSVARNGCVLGATDDDSDGIPNSRDFCAGTVTSERADQYGCSQPQVASGDYPGIAPSQDCLFAD